MPVRISKNRVSLENLPLNEAKGSDIASAATVNLNSATGNLVHITGTTTITAITLSSGYERTVVFDASLTLTHNASTLILPGNANITTASGDRAIFRGDGTAVRCISYIKATGEAVVGGGNAYSLTNLLYPSSDGHWRDIYRSGWKPSFFNQQWGGAQWGGAPDGSKVDFATGYIETSNEANPSLFGDAAGRVYAGVRFRVSEAISVSAVWLKLYKFGNPADDFITYIYSDSSGAPGSLVTNGTSVSTSGKTLTASSNGNWYRISFTVEPSLSANTDYWILTRRTGSTDASNYYGWLRKDPTVHNPTYPWTKMAEGTSTPTWTTYTTYSPVFLVENSSSTKFLQPSGQFDGKLVFAEGNPLNQSKGLSQSLKNFFDGREFTYRGVFTGLTKDKTVADFLYGLDHDRVVLRCNVTTGYMQVDVYESDGTKHTVTGTTDCSSGTKDIAIYIRAKGDGSDSVKLYVNGVSEGTPVTSQTITFDVNFKDLGTAWIGGGFPVAPTWTKDTAMGSLPSADGWTYTGTATEGNAFSVSGGKLYQNKNGYAATDIGYYTRTTTLSNTNGWAVAWKLRTPVNGGAYDNNNCVLNVADGTKAVQVYHSGEYFIQGGSVSYNYIQLDMKNYEHTFLLVGKGSDFFLFIDGKLAIDGTGKMTGTTTSNSVTIGDATGTSGSNSDAIWDYVKDYNTAWLSPQFTSGSLSEAAFFSGDRTGILPSLYNGGALKSAKEYCGVEKNYIKVVSERVDVRGIVYGPTTTSTSFTLLPDMEAFLIGGDIKAETNAVVANNTLGPAPSLGLAIDGTTPSNTRFNQAVAGYDTTMSFSGHFQVSSGLHKVEARWSATSGTNVSTATYRNLLVETK